MVKPLKRNKSGGKGNEWQKNPRSYLVLLAAVPLVIYFIFSRKNEDRVAPLKSEVQQKTATEPPLQTLEVPAAINIQPDTQQQRLAFRSSLGLNVMTSQLATTDQGVRLPFRFEPKKQWCRGGELDTIKIALRSGTSEDLLVSLEALNQNIPPSIYRTSYDNLLKGIDHEFYIPSESKTISLGLFICRDSKKENSCKKKQLMSHKDIAERFANVKTRDSASGQDYIFYFQQLYLQKDQVYAIDSRDFTDGKANTLLTYAENKLALNKADFQNGWNYSKIIKPIGVKIVDKRVKLTLFYNDPRCFNLAGEG